MIVCCFLLKKIGETYFNYFIKVKINGIDAAA